MRTYLLLLLCSLLAASALALPVIDSEQAVRLVEETLLSQGRDEVVIQVWGPVPPMTEIRGTKGLVMVAPAEGYVVYIDDYPTANLFHPVRYAFVDAATGEVTAVAAKSPPDNYRDYRMVETAIGRILQAAKNRRAPRPDTDPPPLRSDRWAVLMNGGYNSSNNHVRYWNDLSNIYIALNAVYGFNEYRIIVLCSDGLDPSPDQSNGQNSDPDLDGDGDDDINYPCVLSVVDALFAELANLLTEDDKLFIFATDHGGSDGGWNTHFNLWNQEEITDAHFASLLDALPQCEIICTFEPCYSGGFLDDVVVPPGPRVASSACRHDQVSWAMPPNYEYDTYVFHWTAAVKGEDAYGVPVNADYNGDGAVTMNEAFRYAEIHDQSNEEPQYDDYPLDVGMGISLWPTGTGPFLVVAEKEFDDIGGNNNGAPDPGETISLVITLSNVGSGDASNIMATLSTVDPYLTITQNISYFPDMAHFEQGQGAPAYMMDISETCPQGQSVICNLHIEADSAYTNDVVISFMVGDPIYLPSGPDNYGYLAYDSDDWPLFPAYEWVEICPDSGGPGTLIPFINDDQTFQYELPFTFQYYGVEYDTFSIGCNGWISMGVNTVDDYSNSGIPDGDGPSAMIAPYWEDLSPQRDNSGKVWMWYDPTDHRFIVEYNHIEQYSPTGSFETFQIILYDPAHYPTASGDGDIMFQYKNMSATVQSEGTTGIESFDQSDGIQYLFDGVYDSHAAPIENERAVLFVSTASLPDVAVELTPYNPPVQIPAGGGTFDFNIAVANNGSEPVIIDIWTMATLPNGSEYGPIINISSLTLAAGASPDRDRTQSVPAGAPAGAYTYDAYVGIYPGAVWAEDHFDFDKFTMSDGGSIVSNWDNWGESFYTTGGENSINTPREFVFYQAHPNPFNPETVLSFELRAASFVELAVFDVQGREVARLVDGFQPAGSYERTFSPLGLSSGVYFARLKAGGFSRTQKLLLIK